MFEPYAELKYDGRNATTSICAVTAPDSRIKIGCIARLELSMDLAGSELRLWFTEAEMLNSAILTSIQKAKDLAKKCRNVIVMS